METNILLKSEVDGVSILTLNRPHAANALGSELLGALEEALTELRLSEEIRAVVLTGAGDRVFSAGADLKERRGMSESEVRVAVNRIRRVVELVADMPIPVIAAMNGSAFGGGLELALACDLRIAADSGQYGLTETSLAIVPGAGGTQRLPRIIPMAKAMELIFTARRMTASDALEIGLTNHVVPADQVLQKALDIAAEIAENGPIAVRQAKWAIKEGLKHDIATGLFIEQLAYEAVIPTTDRQEALTAFAEKRKPRFRGQ